MPQNLVTVLSIMQSGNHEHNYSITHSATCDDSYACAKSEHIVVSFKHNITQRYLIISVNLFLKGVELANSFLLYRPHRFFQMIKNPF